MQHSQYHGISFWITGYLAVTFFASLKMSPGLGHLILTSYYSTNYNKGKLKNLKS